MERSNKAKRQNETMSQGKDYLCWVCGLQFDNENNLNHHLKSNHLQQPEEKINSSEIQPQKPNQSKAKSNLKSHKNPELRTDPSSAFHPYLRQTHQQNEGIPYHQKDMQMMHLYSSAGMRHANFAMKGRECHKSSNSSLYKASTYSQIAPLIPDCANKSIPYLQPHSNIIQATLKEHQHHHHQQTSQLFPYSMASINGQLLYLPSFKQHELNFQQTPLYFHLKQMQEKFFAKNLPINNTFPILGTGVNSMFSNGSNISEDTVQRHFIGSVNGHVEKAFPSSANFQYANEYTSTNVVTNDQSKLNIINTTMQNGASVSINSKTSEGTINLQKVENIQDDKSHQQNSTKIRIDSEHRHPKTPQSQVSIPKIPISHFTNNPLSAQLIHTNQRTSLHNSHIPLMVGSSPATSQQQLPNFQYGVDGNLMIPLIKIGAMNEGKVNKTGTDFFIPLKENPTIGIPIIKLPLEKINLKHFPYDSVIQVGPVQTINPTFSILTKTNSTERKSSANTSLVPIPKSGNDPKNETSTSKDDENGKDTTVKPKLEDTSDVSSKCGNVV